MQSITTFTYMYEVFVLAKRRMVENLHAGIWKSGHRDDYVRSFVDVWCQKIRVRFIQYKWQSEIWSTFCLKKKPVVGKRVFFIQEDHKNCFLTFLKASCQQHKWYLLEKVINSLSSIDRSCYQSHSFLHCKKCLLLITQ